MSSEVSKVYEFVTSQKENLKLIIDDYLFVKDYTCKNTYYQLCKKKKSEPEYYKTRAITILLNSSHYLKKINHQ